MKRSYTANSTTRHMDQFDLEAMRDGLAARKFRTEFSLERPDTRAQARRGGMLRGKEGAKRRSGMNLIAS